jgi:hypothetical protein
VPRLQEGEIMSKAWISNEHANEMVSKVQSALETKTSKPQDIGELMSLVVNVPSYKIADQSRQGVIKHIYKKEYHRIKLVGDYSNFSLSFDDIISIFWESVFKYLPLAKTRGSVVNTRAVKGQLDADIRQHARATNCNPINWLRTRGILGVRNAINKTYNKNLIQICDECGHKSRADSREVNTQACPKCLSVNTIEYWPDNSSTYKSTKKRICQDCKSTWRRKFAYVCAKCLSVCVHIESIFDNKSIELCDISVDDTIEDEHVDLETDDEIKKIISGLYEALPLNPDPNNKTTTKTREVLDILFKPEVSADICAKCAFKASGSNKTCGADSFSMDRCLNYGLHISEYQGVSSALAARRIKIIRKYFIKYIMDNQHNDLCASTYKQLKIRGRV